MRNPYASYAENFAEQLPLNSDMARTIRRGDARLRLKELAIAEVSLCEQEWEFAAIVDPLQRRCAQHSFDMGCLIRFGCRADERTTFREILSGVAEHGGLTLFEAAKLANSICSQRNEVNRAMGQRNGQSVESGVTTISADAAGGSR